MAEEEDDMVNCLVCFEPYELVEEHVPRILPCSHTVCHGCIHKLLKNGSLDCPECREQHTLKEGSTTFPQNKYILRHLHSRENQQSKTSESVAVVDKCRRHARQANLYCKEYECREAICQECLVNNHKFHDIVDIKEERKDKLDALFKTIPKAREHLLTGQSVATRIKTEMEGELDSTFSELEQKHHEIVYTINTFFEALKEIVSYKKGLVAENYGDDIQDIEAKLGHIKEVETSASAPDFTLHDISKGINEINKICESRLKLRRIDRSVLGYDQAGRPVESDAIDKILKFKFRISEAESGKDIVTEPSPPEATRVQLTFTQGRSFTSPFNTIHSVAITPTGRLVVAGLQKVWCTAVLYNLTRNTKIREISLSGGPKGMSVLQAEGTRVAFSLSDKFIELQNMEGPTNFESIPFHPRDPGVLCGTSDEGLFFEDTSTVPRRVVYIQNLSKLSASSTVIHTDMQAVHDMCCAEYQGHKRLVVTGGTDGVEVHDTDSGKLLWNSKEKQLLRGMEHDIDAHGVTADQSGHIFVCDRANSCVHMFEAASGTHIEAVLKEGQLGLGQPWWIRWIDPDKLVVIHKTGFFTWKITTLTVT